MNKKRSTDRWRRKPAHDAVAQLVEQDEHRRDVEAATNRVVRRAREAGNRRLVALKD
jgi:hypothetical protein